MGMAYNPRDASRPNDFQISYMVNTTGDRWFIPYNDNDSMADQLAQCKVIVGQTTDGSDCGVEVDSAPRTSP
tara:strand:+ start:172 stop:387 length:216 start_codon:yes stop_codon:yes gene_type:complete